MQLEKFARLGSEMGGVLFAGLTDGALVNTGGMETRQRKEPCQMR
jgi:hypothetical protein